jgi:hypothetical protein
MLLLVADVVSIVVARPEFQGVISSAVAGASITSAVSTVRGLLWDPSGTESLAGYKGEYSASASSRGNRKDRPRSQGGQILETKSGSAHTLISVS